MNVELGSKVKCKVTGLVGIVTAKAAHLYGCNRVWIQPPVEKESKVPDGCWMDEAQVEIIEPQVIRKDLTKNTGGPMGGLK